MQCMNTKIHAILHPDNRYFYQFIISFKKNLFVRKFSSCVQKGLFCNLILNFESNSLPGYVKHILADD